MNRVSRAAFPALGMLLALWTFLAASCGGGPTEALSPTATPFPTETPVPTPRPTAAMTPTQVPTSPATPSLPTAAQIFARISPSMAFIKTGSGTGSGVLIDGGYVLTNAHVVWPFEQVRVTFPDGSEFQDAPVVNTDSLGDLALIGPLVTSNEHLELVDGEDLAVGSDEFLIGYPAEGEEFPQPTITRGILSRFREWNALGISYFQTDAAIAGGQSGGVLVSDADEIIGISGFSLGEAGFGLVASATDLLSRIDSLIAGEDVSGLGDREIPFGGGRSEQTSTLDSFWDTGVYVVNNPVGETIDLSVDSVDDVSLFLVDVFGNLVIEADNGLTGIESGPVNTNVDAPHFALVTLAEGNIGFFQLSSNRSLAALHDPDDGKMVAAGQTIQGNMDYPFDFDYFLLDLKKVTPLTLPSIR